MHSITPEQELVLQSFLARKAQEWQEYVKEYPELLSLASYHIAPDGGYIAIEHERQEVMIDSEQHQDTLMTDIIIRKSPACTNVITKL